MMSKCFSRLTRSLSVQSGRRHQSNWLDISVKEFLVEALRRQMESTTTEQLQLKETTKPVPIPDFDLNERAMEYYFETGEVLENGLMEFAGYYPTGIAKSRAFIDYNAKISNNTGFNSNNENWVDYCASFPVKGFENVEPHYTHPIQAICYCINEASEKIDIYVAWYGNESIHERVCLKNESGVQVRMIISYAAIKAMKKTIEMVESHNEYIKQAEIDTTPIELKFAVGGSNGFFHNKGIVIDNGKMSYQGSNNWSDRAADHWEGGHLFYNHKISEKHQNYFDDLWANSSGAINDYKNIPFDNYVKK